jgi:RimJ/RimL family protein N-acetyltransferase
MDYNPRRSDLRRDGQKVQIRPFTQADAAPVYFLWSNWRVERSASLRLPRNIAEIQHWIEQPGEGAFPLAIVRNHRCIGAVQIAIETPGVGSLSFWLGEPYWGLGYATEAGRLAIDVAVRDLRLRELIAWRYQENKPAAKVLQKLGFNYNAADIRQDDVQPYGRAGYEMALDPLIADGVRQKPRPGPIEGVAPS